MNLSFLRPSLRFFQYSTLCETRIHEILFSYRRICLSSTSIINATMAQPRDSIYGLQSELSTKIDAESFSFIRACYQMLGIWWIKRTFQPSLCRQKRKHGFLARIRTKDGRRVLSRRKSKGRTRLCV